MQQSTRGLIFVALTITCLDSSAVAQTTLWGMQRGDSFRVLTTIERQTTVQLDEDVETKTRFRDTFTIEYRVRDVLAGGDVSLQVRLVTADRTINNEANGKGRQQLALLKNLAVLVTVDPAGVVTEVSGHENAFNQILDAHQAGREFIGEGVTKDVFRSWISHPFFVSKSFAEPDEAQSWERIHDISLGLMGRLRTVATCETGKTEGTLTAVKISGDSRHVPAESDGQKALGTVLQFTAAKATMDSFEGEGHFAVPPKSPTKPKSDQIPIINPEPKTQPKRPLFEDITLRFSFSGEATATVGGKEKKFSFRQQQAQTSKLLRGYRIGQPSRYQMLNQP